MIHSASFRATGSEIVAAALVASPALRLRTSSITVSSVSLSACDVEEVAATAAGVTGLRGAACWRGAGASTGAATGLAGGRAAGPTGGRGARSGGGRGGRSDGSRRCRRGGSPWGRTVGSRLEFWRRGRCRRLGLVLRGVLAGIAGRLLRSILGWDASRSLACSLRCSLARSLGGFLDS